MANNVFIEFHPKIAMVKQNRVAVAISFVDFDVDIHMILNIIFISV